MGFKVLRYRFCFWGFRGCRDVIDLGFVDPLLASDVWDFTILGIPVSIHRQEMGSGEA